jgi:hypothetical protein
MFLLIPSTLNYIGLYFYKKFEIPSINIFIDFIVNINPYRNIFNHKFLEQILADFYRRRIQKILKLSKLFLSNQQFVFLMQPKLLFIHIYLLHQNKTSTKF